MANNKKIYTPTKKRYTLYDGSTVRGLKLTRPDRHPHIPRPIIDTPFNDRQVTALIGFSFGLLIGLLISIGA